MTMTPAQLKAAVNAANPGRNWDQSCQAFVYQSIKASVGTPKTVYPSARAARLASKIESTDPMAAPPGAIHYWLLGTADHDGVSLGDGLVAYATAKGDTVETWATGVKVSHVTSYPSTYVGWSHTNGVNGGVAVSALSAALTPTQRKVKSTGKVNRRTGPGEAYPEVTPQNDLAVNVVGNFVAFAHGPASKKQPAGNDVWFKGTSGDWFWSGGFTSTATTGLTDLTASFADPVVVPPPVVVPTKITRTAGKLLVNRRQYPTTDPAVAPDIEPGVAAGAVVEVTSFATGVPPEGQTNKIWFHLADGTWAWSGGFTDVSTTGLTEETVTIPVVTPPVVTDPDNTLSAKVAELEAEATTLRATNASLADTNAGLQQANDALNAQVSSLTTQVSSLTAFQTKAKAGINSAVAELNTLVS